MNILIKKYSQLSRDELYELLQLRSAVFVVEQHCVYQDIDGKDQKALHIIGKKNGEIVAYTRIFDAGDYLDKAAIGRVVVREDQRAFGFGKDIISASIRAVYTHFDTTEIQLSAQTYLKKFYTDMGFIAIGEEYLEDDIPHIMMVMH